MRKIFNNPHEKLCDFHFVLNDATKVFVHRAILCARSAFFRESLCSEWATRSFKPLPNRRVDPKVFTEIVKFLYISRLEIKLDEVEAAVALCEKCKLEPLAKAIRTVAEQTVSEWVVVDAHTPTPLITSGSEYFLRLARSGFPKEILRSTLYTFESSSSSSSEENSNVNSANSKATKEGQGKKDDLTSSSEESASSASASSASPSSLLLLRESASDDIVEPSSSSSTSSAQQLNGISMSTGGCLFSDVEFEVDGLIFACHRVFMQRCDYFRALLDGFFKESNTCADGSRVARVKLTDVSALVFAIIVEFVYTEKAYLLHRMDSTFLVEVLRCADEFLLSGLKNICVTYITQMIDADNVFDIFALAQTYNLPRLEDAVVAHFAMNIDDILPMPQFAALVTASAYSIAKRQATDSIPIVDEIFSHLERMYGAMEQYQGLSSFEISKLEEKQRREEAIKDLLAKLGLSMTPNKKRQA